MKNTTNTHKAPMAPKAKTTTSPAPKAIKAPAPVKAAPVTSKVTLASIVVMFDTFVAKFDKALKALAEMVRGTESRITALETQCEVLERIIVGLQTAQQAPAPSIAPAPKTAPAPAPKTAPAPALDSFDKVLEHTAQCVIENSALGFVNDKVIPQTDCDYRVYLKTAQNKTFKLARMAANMSLVDATNALQTAVEALCN